MYNINLIMKVFNIVFNKEEKTVTHTAIQKINFPGYQNQFSINPKIPLKIMDKFAFIRPKIEKPMGSF